MSDTLRRAVEAMRDELKAGDVVAVDDYIEGRNDERGKMINRLDALLDAHPPARVIVQPEPFRLSRLSYEAHDSPIKFVEEPVLGTGVNSADIVRQGGESSSISITPAPPAKRWRCKGCGVIQQTEGVLFLGDVRRHWNSDYTNVGLLSPRWCGPVEEEEA